MKLWAVHNVQEGGPNWRIQVIVVRRFMPIVVNHDEERLIKEFFSGR